MRKWLNHTAVKLVKEGKKCLNWSIVFTLSINFFSVSDESVYMWLMVSTLPPIYDSLPHSHPSNPIQLFSMDTITLYTDENCSVLTMKTNENPENSYRPVSTEKNMKPEPEEREPEKTSDKRVMVIFEIHCWCFSCPLLPILKYLNPIKFNCHI